MSSLDRGAYNQRRSASGLRYSQIPYAIQEMESEGRKPIYGPQGNIRAIPYSMRAPQSPLETMQDRTGITSPSDVSDGFGSPEHDAGWNKFFKTYATAGRGVAQPTGFKGQAGSVEADYHDEQDPQYAGSGTPTSYGTNFVGSGVPNPASHIGASIAQNSQWLGQQGIAFPPPPTNRFPGDSGTASLAPRVASQARPLPAPLTGPMGNSGTDAANLAQNQSLYAPGGWKAPQNNFPTGWQGPKSPVTTGNYTSQYGTASVSNFPRTPLLPASNTIWGQNNNG